MNKTFQHFIAVSEHKNLSSASEALHITQPALSRSIKNLEKEFGVPLFERLPRGVILTHYGEILLERVLRMETEYLFAMKEIKAVKKGSEVKIRIGADNLWAEHYLKNILDDFYDLFPTAEVTVKAGPVDTLIPNLLEGKLDIIFGNVDYPLKSKDFRLIREKLIDVNFRVIARDQHPLHKIEKISTNNLSEYKWVIYQQSDSYVWHINELFYNKKINPAKVSLHTAFLAQAVDHMKKYDTLMYMPEKLLGSMALNNISVLENISSIYSFNSGVWYLDRMMQLHGPRTLLALTKKYFN